MGRPLFAGMSRMPWPSDPHGRLWHVVTLLREHRGDSHVAACVAAGLDGIEANVLTELWVGFGLLEYTATRGWSAEAMDAALARLSSFAFPGNVRQLENICHWLTVMAPAQLIEPKDLPREVVAGPAEPAARGQERRLVEAGCRHRRQAPHVGLADRTADLLGDVKQRPHERVDGPASIAGPNRWLEPAILQRGHSPSAPADLLLPL